MNVKRATKTIRRCTVVLNASDVRVACGNCDVDVDDETPIRITWTEETTS